MDEMIKAGKTQGDIAGVFPPKRGWIPKVALLPEEEKRQ